MYEKVYEKVYFSALYKIKIGVLSISQVGKIKSTLRKGPIPWRTGKVLSLSPTFMARRYRDMPLLWEVQELLELSDLTPSGLAWKTTTTRHREGDAAGNYNPHNGFYVVFLYGVPYVAHRLVSYLRTGADPGDADVMHADAKDGLKDNRKSLHLRQRKDRSKHS